MLFLELCACACLAPSAYKLARRGVLAEGKDEWGEHKLELELSCDSAPIMRLELRARVYV